MNQIGLKNDKTHYYGSSVNLSKNGFVNQNEKLIDGKKLDEEDFLKRCFLKVDYRTAKFNKKDGTFQQITRIYRIYDE